MRIAFALAGLGGFNAHGAGFLAAATKCGVVPELVTATSGQIVVLANWLAGRDLEESLITAGNAADPLAQVRAVLFGDPGVFRPAYWEALARFTAWPDFKGGLLNLVADRLLPAQQYVPERRDADFAEIATTLNASPIGVVFNTYDPRSGQGFLFGNDAARAAAADGQGDRQHARRNRKAAAGPARSALCVAGRSRARHPSDHGRRREIRAVAVALRLPRPAGRTDGRRLSPLLHHLRTACVRPRLRGAAAGAGLARQGTGQLVRGAGLAVRDVVLGRLQGRGRCSEAHQRPDRGRPRSRIRNSGTSNWSRSSRKRRPAISIISSSAPRSTTPPSRPRCRRSRSIWGRRGSENEARLKRSGRPASVGLG